MIQEMYKKALEINEALGRKEGMASTYGKLGTVYKTREILRAEAMYKKSLLLWRELTRVQWNGAIKQ
jgi:hypothetical protein